MRSRARAQLLSETIDAQERRGAEVGAIQCLERIRRRATPVGGVDPSAANMTAGFTFLPNITTSDVGRHTRAKIRLHLVWQRRNETAQRLAVTGIHGCGGSRGLLRAAFRQNGNGVLA